MAYTGPTVAPSSFVRRAFRWSLASNQYSRHTANLHRDVTRHTPPDRLSRFKQLASSPYNIDRSSMASLESFTEIFALPPAVSASEFCT